MEILSRYISNSKFNNKISNNEYFPCDLLLLGSSDSKGVAYIETKNLDGETNLKHRVAPKELRKLLTSEEEVFQSQSP